MIVTGVPDADRMLALQSLSPPRIVDRGIIAIGETSQTHHHFIAA